MGARCFEELEVWRKAHQVAQGVYELTSHFPTHQRYVPIPQMQRAALSIPAHITEGFGRRRPRDKARFYNIAETSADELHDFFMFSKSVKYLPAPHAMEDVLAEVRTMLRRLTDLTLPMV